MSGPAWMPFYPSDYLSATGHLSPAQHGAYILLICHYWQKGGLPKDDRLLARICRMSDREWRGSRDILAEFFGPDWTHNRIEKELQKSQQKSEKRAQSGSRGGAAKSLKNKETPVANATILPEQNSAFAVASSSQPDREKKKAKVPLAQKELNRGTRLPPSWQPSEDDRAFALAEGLSGPEILREVAKYRDFWVAKPGQPGVKLDWPATWRNWIRRVIENQPKKALSNGNRFDHGAPPLSGPDALVAAARGAIADFAKQRGEVARRHDFG